MRENIKRKPLSTPPLPPTPSPPPAPTGEEMQGIREEKPSSALIHAEIHAGFPSPAGDSGFEPLDLNRYFIKKPHATFFLRVRGDSMSDAGILEEDLLVDDRSLEARHGQIVIAMIEEELTVKRLSMVEKGGQTRIMLLAENSHYKPILVQGELQIWGVVTGVLRRL